jgi:hypothetical protein
MDTLLIFSFFQLTTVAINPDGRSYASGAEDGYVRLHFFDKDYLDMEDPVPEAEGEEENEGDVNNDAS